MRSWKLDIVVEFADGKELLNLAQDHDEGLYAVGIIEREREVAKIIREFINCGEKLPDEDDT